MTTSRSPGQALHGVRSGDRPRSHDGTSDAEQQILQATERLLATTPLSELSVAQILTEAGVSRATFYFYFSSKYGPVTALLASIVDRIFERVPFFTGGTDPQQGRKILDKGLEGSGGLFRDHRTILRATVEHWHAVPELKQLWLEIMERFTASVADQIDQQRAAGLAPPGPPSRVLATGLLWSSERMLYMAGLGVLPDLPDEDHALTIIKAIWQGAIYGTVPAPSQEPSE